MTYRLAVIGGGNMGAALAGGLVATGWATPEDLVVVEVAAGRRGQLSDSPDLRGVAVVAAPEDIEAEGAVIAVKPQDAVAAARAALAAGVTRLLSIAAGVPTGALEVVASPPVPVVRAMPNTAALVGAGASAIAAGSAAGEADLAWAEGILRAVGTVVRTSESALDAVTGLSGSGPAYLLLVAEALVDGGVGAGLARDVSSALVQQLFVGCARLMAESGESPAALRAAVTSPGGTTAAGVVELERAAVRAAFIDAVAAATERSRQLGASTITST